MDTQGEMGNSVWDRLSYLGMGAWGLPHSGNSPHGSLCLWTPTNGCLTALEEKAGFTDVLPGPGAL